MVHLSSAEKIPGTVITLLIDTHRWGFTDSRGVSTSARSKREHLKAFIDQEIGKKQSLVIVGASLGGAIALDFAAAYPDAVQRLVLIDAQVTGC